MQYLLYLNRFEKDKSTFDSKLVNLDIRIIKEEKYNFIIEAKKINELLKLEEVSRIFKIISDWKELRFDELKKDSLKAIKESGLKDYKIQTKFHDKIKISSKSIYKHINPYLKHDGFSFSEEGVVIYVEFMKKEDIFYRISYSLPEWFNTLNPVKVDYSKFIVIIENPSLVEEVSDFLRLCWIFKIPLCILTKNKDFDKILKKAKEITKGIDYDEMKLNISEKLPNGYTLVGFSKLARNNETGLKNILLKDEKIALVFGDDKFGLSQGLRDKVKFMFRLTPEIKKPLRGSHALSYVLGLYSALKIY